MTSSLPDMTTYIIANGVDTTLTPAWTQSVTGQNCLSTATLQFLNTVTNKYIVDNTGQATINKPYEFVKSFSTTTGELVINTKNFLKYANRSDFKAKLTIILPESISTATSIDYYFSIRIQTACYENSLQIT